MKEPMQHKSFMNPELEITDNQYAISYVKKNYDSGSSLPEHAFMIIQSPYSVMRAEILKEHSEISYEVLVYQAEFIDSFARRKYEAFLILDKLVRKTLNEVEIWTERDSFELRQKCSSCQTDKELHAFLWAISLQIKEQVKNKTLVYEGPTPFQLYTTQIFAGNEYMDACRTLIWDPKGVKKKFDREDAAPKKSLLSHRTWLIDGEKARAFMGALSDEKGKFIPYSVFGNTSILKYTNITAWCHEFLMNLIVRRANDPVYVAPAEDYTAHNCATWVVEKLRGLNIPEIDKDLAQAPSFSRIAYVTSFDIGNRREAQGFLTVTMPMVVGVLGAAPSAMSTGGAAGALAMTVGSTIAAPVAYTALASSGCAAIEVASCIAGKAVMKQTNWEQQLENKPNAIGRE